MSSVSAGRLVQPACLCEFTQSELKATSYRIKHTELKQCVWIQTQRLLELLAMFESGPLARLDLRQYYLLLLQRYSRDLELLRKTYQKHKDRPPIGRNLPPVLTPAHPVLTNTSRKFTTLNPSVKLQSWRMLLLCFY